MLKRQRGATQMTSLPDQAYSRTLKVVLRFLRNEERITNSRLRSLTSLNSDQSVQFFNKAISLGELQCRGKTSGTHYVLPQSSGDPRMH